MGENFIPDSSNYPMITDSMVRHFGSMRVHYEEYTASRGSLSGKMLMEEAMSRFKTSQDNLETR